MRHRKTLVYIDFASQSPKSKFQIFAAESKLFNQEQSSSSAREWKQIFNNFQFKCLFECYRPEHLNDSFVCLNFESVCRYFISAALFMGRKWCHDDHLMALRILQALETFSSTAVQKFSISRSEHSLKTFMCTMCCLLTYTRRCFHSFNSIAFKWPKRPERRSLHV